MAEELELTPDEIKGMGVVSAGFMGVKQKEKVEEVKTETPKPEETKEVKPEEVKEVKTEEKKEEVKETKKMYSDAFKNKKVEDAEKETAEKIKDLKLEETQAELAKTKALIEVREKIDKENEAIESIKQSLGDEWSPEVEKELSDLIESDFYDKFDKAGFTAQEKMLELTNIAIRKVGENGNRAVKEKIKEIKNVSTVNLKSDTDVKTRSKEDVMNDYRKTGNEKYLDEVMRIDDNEVLKFMSK